MGPASGPTPSGVPGGSGEQPPCRGERPEVSRLQPRTSSLTWPAIKEPAASVAWSLAALDDPEHERLDRLVDVVEQGLTSRLGPKATMLALDWQHTPYRFAPQSVGGPGQPAWPLSPYPDGDNYIYLSEDFRTGSFGHPQGRAARPVRRGAPPCRSGRGPGQ
ncbi:DUF2716 domain-containing protein [Streptomyces globisporus]|uniref:DUF2716 domain-containing protein n=1 Tax=Streptomyces globisporus TaxID=1908 RepID=UPI0036FC5D77